ncbi:MAG: hypothetical protein HKN45_04425 [Flavobacteriales bacterium]|nr:hypothetical protein [Flavobacteriales bacterium]NNK80554.1 hypothetical protein [Flavobacteriales bacterium]
MKQTIIALFLIFGIQSYSQDDLPRQYKEVDTNGNGFIEVIEVQRLIDGYFIGTHDRGVMYIHNLIDYFFEQP